MHRHFTLPVRTTLRFGARPESHNDPGRTLLQFASLSNAVPARDVALPMRMPSRIPRPHRMAASIIAAGFTLALLAGCGRQDDRHARDTQERRIVSVSKQINEFIFAIGAQHDLVAVD